MQNRLGESGDSSDHKGLNRKMALGKEEFSEDVTHKVFFERRYFRQTCQSSVDGKCWARYQWIAVLHHHGEDLLVLSGMDVVRKIEAEGRQSGEPKNRAVIADSGEMPHGKL